MEFLRCLKLETYFCNFLCNFLTSFWKMQFLSIIRRNCQKEIVKTSFWPIKVVFCKQLLFETSFWSFLGFKKVVFLVAFNFNSRYVLFLLFFNRTMLILERMSTLYVRKCMLRYVYVCYDMSTKLHDRLLPTVKTFISAVIMHHFQYPKKAGQILIINLRNPKTMWRN